jgi:hypothetical protein
MRRILYEGAPLNKDNEMRRILTIAIVLALAAVAASAQRTTVSGTVVDYSTGAALVGASVVGGGQTVVTNDDGYFVLKGDANLTGIVISHVGYRSQRVKVNDQTAQPIRIRLHASTIQLQEVLVMAGDARDLVYNAISKIPKNYSRSPELYHCFYRETAMKRQHYIMVAEGVVDMYKTAYGRNDYHDRVAIRKGRRLLSPKQGDTLSVKVMGGPITPVQLDIVKNLQFLLNEEVLDCYELKMETPTSIADRPQFVVSIEPRRVMPYALYFGRLYIDQETLAFTRAELTLDVSNREKATALMLVRKPLGVRFRPKEMSLQVDYRYEDGVTRISYLRTKFRFNCDWRRRLFATSFTACCEMVVTSHEDENIEPIRGRESFDQRDAFFDKVDYFRDPSFWQDYNIIEPSESLDRAINRLLKKR